MPLSALPWQAVEAIAANSGQADCVALGMAIPALLPFTVPRLYKSIVVDLGPRSLDKYIEFDDDNNAITVVRTSAGLRRCFQVLSDMPQYAAQVEKLTVKSNLPLSDHTVRLLLSGSFKNLANLTELHWDACPELPLNVLDLLPNKHLLRVLDVDLAVRGDFPPMQFDNLEIVSVRPYLAVQCLTWLRESIRNARDLKELELRRYLDEKRQVGSGYAFIGSSDLVSSGCDVKLLTKFFGSDKSGAESGEPSAEKLKLTRLELYQFLHDNDADILFDCVSFEHVHTLGLAGQDSAASRSLFLEQISYKTPQLKHLSLDWNAPAEVLVSYLDHLSLESLEIRLYANPMQMLDAVGRQRALKRLKVSSKCRFSEQDFRGITNLKQLESLVVPFNFQVRTWKLISQLAVTNLGLIYGEQQQTQQQQQNSLITCGLLSMWNDEFAYPLQYAGLLGELRQHATLRKVEIDGHCHILRI